MDTNEFLLTTDRVLTYGGITITLTAEQAKEFQQAVAHRPTPFWYDFAAVAILIGNGVPITLQRRVEGADRITSYDFAASARGIDDADAPALVLEEDRGAAEG